MTKTPSLAEAAREVIRLSKGPTPEEHVNCDKTPCSCDIFDQYDEQFFRMALHVANLVNQGDAQMLGILARHGLLTHEETPNSSRLVSKSRYQDTGT